MVGPLLERVAIVVMFSICFSPHSHQLLVSTTSSWVMDLTTIIILLYYNIACIIFSGETKAMMSNCMPDSIIFSSMTQSMTSFLVLVQTFKAVVEYSIVQYCSIFNIDERWNYPLRLIARELFSQKALLVRDGYPIFNLPVLPFSHCIWRSKSFLSFYFNSSKEYPQFYFQYRQFTFDAYHADR